MWASVSLRGGTRGRLATIDLCKDGVVGRRQGGGDCTVHGRSRAGPFGLFEGERRGRSIDGEFRRVMDFTSICLGRGARPDGPDHGVQGRLPFWALLPPADSVQLSKQVLFPRDSIQIFLWIARTAFATAIHAPVPDRDMSKALRAIVEVLRQRRTQRGAGAIAQIAIAMERKFCAVDFSPPSILCLECCAQRCF